MREILMGLPGNRKQFELNTTRVYVRSGLRVPPINPPAFKHIQQE